MIRLQQAPIPKEFRDAVVPAAQALKDALEAEETVGDSFIGEEAEKTLSAMASNDKMDKKPATPLEKQELQHAMLPPRWGGLEQKAGQLIQKYGEKYMAQNALPPDDPLVTNQVGMLLFFWCSTDTNSIGKCLSLYM